MRCPTCGEDLLAGARRCPGCGEHVVSDLDPSSRRRVSGELGTAALAAIVAIAVIFLVRAGGTFWVPQTAPAAVVTSSATLLANVIVVVFLMVFHRRFPGRRGSHLSGATTVLLGTSVARTVVVSLAVLRALGVKLVAVETAAAIGIVVSLLLAFAALMFFTSLCSQLEDEDSVLARAVRFAVAGALVWTVAQAAAFALFATRLMHPELVPVTSPLLRVVAVLVAAFVVATQVGFLAALRGELRRVASAAGG